MTAAAKNNLINSFINEENPNQFEARLNVFIDQSCKEQREICAKAWSDKETYSYKCIINAPKPDGL